MYSTCLFCHDTLGNNAAIEHFPVGRRLAYDAAKGRLWVVCRKCERWNLTPLEERWEAIEECERAFSATKLRVSTEHVGLARLKEGLELVRIGEPQRPEMAAWRYGDQFGRRRRKQFVTVAGATVVVGGVLIFGPMVGLVGAGAFSPMLNLLNAGNSIYRARTLIQVPTSAGETLRVRLSELPKTELHADGDGIRLRISAVRTGLSPSRWLYGSQKMEVDLTGEEALTAAAALLPRLNAAGGSRDDVSRAVGYLEESSDPKKLFRRAVDAIEKRESEKLYNRGTHLLKNLPTAGRLALEMAAHEDSERRALEGELHILEAAWREAEEIAGIADNLFLPESIDDDLARLKKKL
ncbi:MAG: hypothetical protein JWL61_1132 [Gemmatimonadetes bacterium]|jgi:hypothetical protein|nr:hypothetical protein [Gemmatimonadota bacterium]